MAEGDHSAMERSCPGAAATMVANDGAGVQNCRNAPSLRTGRPLRRYSTAWTSSSTRAGSRRPTPMNSRLVKSRSRGASLMKRMALRK